MTKPTASGKLTQDLRPPTRPTRKIPQEVLRALLQETRDEDAQRVAEWEDDGQRTR